tara:strand:- start:1618 stop:2127 length:510 start_codon:yes stop_codon:yes gene_type:complete
MPARRAVSPSARLSTTNWVIAKFTDGEWYPAKIAKRHEDGQFDLAYDDGDFEEGVAPENVLRVGSYLKVKKGQGKSSLVDGVVKTINADGGLTVRFESGTAKVMPDAISEKLEETPLYFRREAKKGVEPLPAAAPRTAASLPTGIIIIVAALGALGLFQFSLFSFRVFQ